MPREPSQSRQTCPICSLSLGFINAAGLEMHVAECIKQAEQKHKRNNNSKKTDKKENKNKEQNIDKKGKGSAVNNISSSSSSSSSNGAAKNKVVKKKKKKEKTQTYKSALLTMKTHSGANYDAKPKLHRRRPPPSNPSSTSSPSSPGTTGQTACLPVSRSPTNNSTHVSCPICNKVFSLYSTPLSTVNVHISKCGRRTKPRPIKKPEVVKIVEKPVREWGRVKEITVEWRELGVDREVIRRGLEEDGVL
ncbi:hypothetical protein TrST_g5460 [Triparma strigata]|uniref:Uncharacterized protein n=1 Tax=Triparma strigata TaxID=1606541 RepID=A0A9W7CAF2_9STRA|nr:hypothetical protein TrST_g5460 [Triparma strigata]